MTPHDRANARVLILFNAVAADAPVAERDVLAQMEVVAQACRELGYSFEKCGCTADLQPLIERLQANPPSVVFNLVESLAGYDKLAWLIPALLETLQIPCTGTPAVPLNLSNDKLRTKQKLQLAGLPTPVWHTAESLSNVKANETFTPGQYILKAIGEHASLGLDDTAVVFADSVTELQARIQQQSARLEKPCFAEQFIAGREFNLSVLANGSLPEVLPPAEIDFSAFPAGKPRIVGAAAKWDEGTFEFDHTPRKFAFPASDEPLLNELRSLARSCWQVLELAGWARVDFRVDLQDRPFILEVNTNCCLSPDAGFAAAVEQAGYTLTDAVERILATVLAPREGVLAPRESLPQKSPAPKSRSEAQLRSEVLPTDEAHVREIVAATGLFRPNEVDVAAELVRVRLRDGAASGYEFMFAEQNGNVLGYACYGLNTVTLASYDLYWIAVRPNLQGQGIGRQLLQAVEEKIAAAGGQQIYIETSHRADYAATRGFYERCGYALEGVLRDYYAPGDDRAIYVRRR